MHIWIEINTYTCSTHVYTYIQYMQYGLNYIATHVANLIERANVHSKLAGIVPYKPKQFPHSKDHHAMHNRDYFETVRICLDEKQCSMSWTGAIH
jgi:hypothetical protein